MLEAVEEALDQIALLVQLLVVRPLHLAVGLRRDHGHGAGCLDLLNDGIAVVALVGDDGLGCDLLQEGVGVRAVMDVPGR